jgi:hypothetical protein
MVQMLMLKHEFIIEEFNFVETTACVYAQKFCDKLFKKFIGSPFPFGSPAIWSFSDRFHDFSVIFALEWVFTSGQNI